MKTIRGSFKINKSTSVRHDIAKHESKKEFVDRMKGGKGKIPEHLLAEVWDKSEKMCKSAEANVPINKTAAPAKKA